MANLGVRCARGTISHADCRQCALNPLHPCQYPPDVLESMRPENSDEPSNDSFSPSRVVGCARQHALYTGADYYIDVEKHYPLTRGHMIHALMERSAYPGALGFVREQRLTIEVPTRFGPQQFSGKPDLIVLKAVEDGTLRVKLVDYKSISDISHQMTAAKVEHVWQVNMYAWLIEEKLAEAARLDVEKVEVDELEIVYGSMAKMRRFTSAGWLQARGKRIPATHPQEYETLALEPLDHYPHDAVGAAVVARIEERLQARTILPPVLEQDARWQCDYCPLKDLCYSLPLEGGVEVVGRR